MTTESARVALAMFDPVLVSSPGVDAVRGVLDQARRSPLSADAPFPLSDEARARLTEQHRIGPLARRRSPIAGGGDADRSVMMAQLQLSTVARELTAALNAAGVESRVLKGLATSELDYASPNLRHTGDVDLLVRRSDIRSAVDCLIDAGCVPNDETAQRAGRLHDGSNLKGVVLEHPTGVEVDVHYRLTRFTRSTADPLMVDGEEMRFGLTALSPEGRLIHAASHAVLTPNPGRRLSSIADVVAIIDNTGIDWARARRLADASALTGAVGAALRAEAALMGRDPHPGLAWPAPSKQLAALIETQSSRLWLQHLLAISALPAGLTRRSYITHRLRPVLSRIDPRTETY